MAMISGQVLAATVTDAGRARAAGIVGQLGYGPVGSDPLRLGADWSGAAADVRQGRGQHDEYKGRVRTGQPRKYAYDLSASG